MDHDAIIKEIKAVKQWLGAGSINIFGVPFAGKDTQGKILAGMLEGPLLGGGDILRNSVLPDHVRAAQKKGLLIPTEDYVSIVLPYLSRKEFQNHPLILSSVGRWHGEEESVLRATEESGHPVRAVFYLNMSEEIARQRWAKSQEERSKGDRGDRSDDTKEALEIRLKEFREKTMPVIEHYRKTDIFFEINAEQQAPEVTADILKTLYDLARS